MMLWLAHFYKDEQWAQAVVPRSLRALDDLWVEDYSPVQRAGIGSGESSPAAPTAQRRGHFSRSTEERDFVLAFGNYGVAIGLQAVGVWPDRVDALLSFFEGFKSGDKYDSEAITWVMACCAHLPGVLIGGGGGGGSSEMK